MRLRGLSGGMTHAGLKRISRLTLAPKAKLSSRGFAKEGKQQPAAAPTTCWIGWDGVNKASCLT